MFPVRCAGFGSGRPFGRFQCSHRISVWHKITDESVGSCLAQLEPSWEVRRLINFPPIISNEFLNSCCGKTHFMEQMKLQ